MLRKLGQFAALTRSERALFVRALAMLPIVDAELRLRGWRRCHARLALQAKRCTARVAGARIAPQRMAWLVERAARRLPWSATCLRRSLVLWALLQGVGAPAALRLGVRKNVLAFEMHAWVELDGLPLNEGLDVRERYAVFDAALAPGNWREA